MFTQTTIATFPSAYSEQIMTHENNIQQQSQKRRSRSRSQSKSVLPIVILIVIAFTVGFYFYVQKSPSGTYLDYGTAIDPPKMTSLPVESQSNKEPGNSETVLSTNDPTSSNGANSNQDTGVKTKGFENASIQKTDITSSDINNKDTQTAEASIQQHTPSLDNGITNPEMVSTLNAFYSHLDKEPYMQEFELNGNSKEHFSKLIQKLVNNPPVVTRETDNLFTLLKNTAHFFRILGKDNILLLKGILDREKDSLEDMLRAFYVLTADPELLQQEYQLTITSEALYDYATFLLNTMGGRLYLFRRDSTSRMAVTYYAIQVLDRANTEGDARHGTDIRPALSSLIDEIENGGIGLKYRDEYLDRLYDLQEKYN